jgi:hypothetical protein
MRCPVLSCKRLFMTLPNVVRHLSSHGARESSFVCAFCEPISEFHDLRDFCAHYKSQHRVPSVVPAFRTLPVGQGTNRSGQSAAGQWLCTECQTGFATKSALDQHSAFAHNTANVVCNPALGLSLDCGYTCLVYDSPVPI